MTKKLSAHEKVVMLKTVGFSMIACGVFVAIGVLLKRDKKGTEEYIEKFKAMYPKEKC